VRSTDDTESEAALRRISVVVDKLAEHGLILVSRDVWLWRGWSLEFLRGDQAIRYSFDSLEGNVTAEIAAATPSGDREWRKDGYRVVGRGGDKRALSFVEKHARKRFPIAQ
jgi:hypothetical protein